MFEGGQISEGGGDKFPRKFGPGGTNFWGGHISCDTGKLQSDFSSVELDRVHHVT